MKFIYLTVALVLLVLQVVTAVEPTEGCLRIKCPQYIDRVCGKVDGNTRIFSNKCTMMSINACLPKEKSKVFFSKFENFDFAIF